MKARMAGIQGSIAAVTALAMLREE